MALHERCILRCNPCPLVWCELVSYDRFWVSPCRYISGNPTVLDPADAAWEAHAHGHPSRPHRGHSRPRLRVPSVPPAGSIRPESLGTVDEAAQPIGGPKARRTLTEVMRSNRPLCERHGNPFGMASPMAFQGAPLAF